MPVSTSVRQPLHAVLAAVVASTVSIMLAACAHRTPAGSPDPSRAVDELLAADRAYASASMQRDVASGLSAMFDDHVMMIVPGRGVTASSAEALAVLRNDTLTAGAHAEWMPIRAGVSADGTQGFTVGYLMLHRAGGASTSQKYLSYWIKERSGWRVAVYKRGRRPAGADPMAPMASVVPETGLRSADARRIAAYRRSLDSTERAFSDDAQVVGLARAFARHGYPTAMNMGAATNGDFVVGPENIGAVVGVDEPATGSSVRWAPDRVIVAPSGDLGITVGTIRGNPEKGAPADLAVPFCTVWYRRSPTEVWRYLAE